MTEAKRGELAVAKMRHTYTMRHGPTEYSYTYVPMIVTNLNVAGRIVKGRNGWNSPVDLKQASDIYVVRGTNGAELLPKLEREYDDLATCRAAVREAMQTVRVEV